MEWLALAMPASSIRYGLTIEQVPIPRPIFLDLDTTLTAFRQTPFVLNSLLKML